MTIRPRLILQLFAIFVSAVSYPSFAQNQDSSAAVTPNAVTTVTTTGGTTGSVPLFSGASTIVNSNIFQGANGIGIGITGAATTLDVNGATTLRGDTTLLRTGTPTTAAGTPSHLLIFSAGAINSATSGLVKPSFQWRAEPTGNNTASPNATLNLLSSNGTAAPAETGFFFNPNGTIHFASGQTFPGGGPFCIATSGGFGNGGTTFVEPGFTVPAVNNCTSWSGFTKTASTVILNTSGAACLSSTGKTLTVSVSSADPAFFGNPVSDYIQLTRTSSTGSFTGGTDQGQFAGSANQVTCTSAVLSLPDSHD